MAQSRVISMGLLFFFFLANGESLFEKGVRLYQEGKKDEAILAFKKVLKEEPENARAHFNIGYIYQKKGKSWYPIAVTWYKKALRLDPSLMEAYFNLGVIFYNQKNYSQAREMFEIAYQLSPKDQDVHQALRETRQALAPQQGKAKQEEEQSKEKKMKEVEPQKESGKVKASPSAIRRFVFAQNVVNREPVHIQDSFTESSERIYVFLEIRVPESHGKILMVWKDPKGRQDYRYAHAIEKAYDRYRFWMWRNCKGYPLCQKKGKWTVEVYYNNAFLAKKTLTIQ